MKKVFLVTILTIIFNWSKAQNIPTHINQQLKNKTAIMSLRIYDGTEIAGKLVTQPNSYTAASSMAYDPNETIIGETTYDLQTNASVQNRIYKNANSTLSAVWNYSTSFTIGSPDRGTGYNYFNQTSWSSLPVARIESSKTGWPSITSLANGKEYILSHNTTNTELQLTYRSTIGSGSWTEDITQFPSPITAGNWFPRMVSGGIDGNSLHLISITNPVSVGGALYNGQDGALCYSRSQNGGATWDIINQVPAQLNSSFYKGFSADTYSWAAPRGNTIAYVAGGKFQDVVLMKSVNNGDTWTKTVIAQFPYPFFNEATTLITDTPKTNDGSLAALIDNNGEVHVFWGAMRVNNDVLNNQQLNYYPFTDGLCYWRESMGAGTVADTIAYTIDVNNNQTIDWLTNNPAGYGIGTTSFPSAGVSNDGIIYVTYSGLHELLNQGAQNYRHIYVIKSPDGGNSWTLPLDITTYDDFAENVYGFLAPQIDNYLHLIYQRDYEPGIAVTGEDIYDINDIVYLPIQTSLIVSNPEPVNSIKEVTVYPNPTNGSFTIESNLITNSTIQGEIKNTLGQIVYAFNEKATIGLYKKTIDINLGQGIYYLSLQTREGIENKKIEIVK